MGIHFVHIAATIIRNRICQNDHIAHGNCNGNIVVFRNSDPVNRGTNQHLGITNANTGKGKIRIANGSRTNNLCDLAETIFLGNIGIQRIQITVISLCYYQVVTICHLLQCGDFFISRDLLRPLPCYLLIQIQRHIFLPVGIGPRAGYTIPAKIAGVKIQIAGSHVGAIAIIRNNAECAILIADKNAQISISGITVRITGTGGITRIQINSISIRIPSYSRPNIALLGQSIRAGRQFHHITAIAGIVTQLTGDHRRCIAADLQACNGRIQFRRIVGCMVAGVILQHDAIAGKQMNIFKPVTNIVIPTDDLILGIGNKSQRRTGAFIQKANITVFQFCQAGIGIEIRGHIVCIDQFHTVVRIH